LGALGTCCHEFQPILLVKPAISTLEIATQLLKN
jgi:hypothetical protein